MPRKSSKKLILFKNGYHIVEKMQMQIICINI